MLLNSTNDVCPTFWLAWVTLNEEDLIVLGHIWHIKCSYCKQLTKLCQCFRFYNKTFNIFTFIWKKKWPLNTQFIKFTSSEIREIKACIMLALCKPVFSMLGLAAWHRVRWLVFLYCPHLVRLAETYQIHIVILIKNVACYFIPFASFLRYWKLQNASVLHDILHFSSAVNVLTY